MHARHTKTTERLKTQYQITAVIPNKVSLK